VLFKFKFDIQNFSDLVQIRRYLSARVKYVCFMSAALKYDYLRATTRWRKQGIRYDSVLINGSDGPEFAQVYGFFTVTLHPTIYRVALIRRYHTVGRHLSSNYLQLEDKDVIDFIFADTIIRAAQILPPSTYNHFLTVQDMSPDMYLRLL
jgi:hypothetical protein